MSDWKELSGDKNWEGQLKPPKRNLLKTVVHYGKRVQAIYETIDHGRPIYEKEEFFSKVRLGLYTMNNYIYTTNFDFFCREGSQCSGNAWIGYVAAATDEGKKELGRRDILICWRGTTTPEEVLKDLQISQSSASPILENCSGNPRVHKGFLSLYLSARNQVLEAVEYLMSLYEGEEISITVSGHSLGASLAIMNAADIVAHGYNRPQCMVTVFAFSSPMVGNSDFVTMFNALGDLHLLHIRHFLDPVPKLPPLYSEMGVPLKITKTNLSVSDILQRGHSILTMAQMLGRFHSLKNLLTAIEKQEGKRRRALAAITHKFSALVHTPTDLDELTESILVVEQLANDRYKLYLRTP